MRARLLLICWTLFSISQALAQTEPTDTTPQIDPRHAYDFNIAFGTLISAQTGLNDDVPTWGLKTSLPTSKGVVELGVLSGIGHGIVYRSGSIDYRMDLKVEFITAHVLLGLHGDQYQTDTPAVVNVPYAGGWHYGGGITIPLSGPLLFRFDFRHRFSPGQAIDLMLGLTFRVPE